MQLHLWFSHWNECSCISGFLIGMAEQHQEQQQQQHKAIHAMAFNPVNPSQVCQVVKLLTPTPASGEVLVKMLCRPINPSDIVTLMGFYPGEYEFPHVPGKEGSTQGTWMKFGIGPRVLQLWLVQLGENVSGLEVGQRVFYTGTHGTWQEFMLAKADMLTPVPDSISDEVAAQLYVNPWTACGMLQELNVPKGEYVLQTAAASVLGRMFIQIARDQGIKTINLVRRNEHKAVLKELGVDVLINMLQEDVLQVVQQVTGGKLAYGATDCLGGENTKLVGSLVRDEGTILVYGLLDGEDIRAAPHDIIFRHVKVTGYHLTRWLKKLSTAEVHSFKANVMYLVEEKVIVPLSGPCYPLEQILDALLKSQEPARGGKVLLVN